MPIRMIREFIKMESAGGLILFFCAILALVLDNSPLHQAYEHFFGYPITIGIAPLVLTKSFLHWINDGLMTVFFFVLGLEIKREMDSGELDTLKKMSLPAFAALGGMLVPSAFYVIYNWGDMRAIAGWAIPTATDVAFALAILSLLGSRVPTSLKIFLTTLAIFDDVGAIIIIALFYTASISMFALSMALSCLMLLGILNRFHVKALAPYLLVGLVLWVCVLKSGVHASLAGVLLAFSIPLKGKKIGFSPSKYLEKLLHPWVVLLILPLFALGNAGVRLHDTTASELLGPVSLGIITGLFLGKQIGVFFFSWCAVKLKVAHMPVGTNWLSIYGTALLCGVGFTMSLFIGMLAFHTLGEPYETWVRIGVLLGSMLSGALGYGVLRYALQYCEVKK